MITLAEVLEAYHVDLSTEWGKSLSDALHAREEGIADLLRLAGMQFGLHSPIVAKVLMDVGLGEPPSDEMRTMINNQFAAHMEELRRQFGEGN